MGLKYRDYLSGSRIYGCAECQTHLSTVEAIISKSFQGQHGKAYLFRSVVNVVEGSPENRQMTTGLHTVSDIYCSSCKNIVGWKYVKAYDESQKYKEGKYILEKTLLCDVQ